MKVLKFGGSSLLTPERIRGVAAIVTRARHEGDVAVVVSALGGVTDALLEAAAAAREGGGWDSACDALARRHADAVAALASASDQAAVAARVEAVLAELRDLLHGIQLLGETSPRVLDGVAACGERLSVEIVAAALRTEGADAEACDARRLISTDSRFGEARVELEESYGRIRRHFAEERPLQVVTGFIGASHDGATTTLGRGGSDYTACLLGAALEAAAVEIWTDVDGVMSADPRLVPSSVALAHLSYDELMELSHFGAKVIHPPSVHPARARGIPLVVRNTFRPEAAGTRITTEPSKRSELRPVCGVSSISPIALLRLEGDGMVGVPGIAQRLFGALARQAVNVILISQASSEHSVCFAILPEMIQAASRSIGDEFALERHAGLIDELIVEDDLAVVAVVGAAMSERPGIAGRLFGVLGGHAINVRAIAQGSSELNVSLVLKRSDEAAAVNAIHAALFEPERAVVDVVVAGVGGVGAALLSQLDEQRATLERERGLTLRLAGIASSRHMLLDSEGLDPHEALGRLHSEALQADPAELASFVIGIRRPRRVLVDATASDEIPALYDNLLAKGVRVVTANKRRLAGAFDGYRPLRAAGWRRFFYETTVGAGLPVLRTLHELVATGDQLRRLTGLLSGTLGYLMDEVSKGRRFSEVVREAHSRGYTEPQPLDDLSGEDVARKLIILGREAGLEIERDELEVAPLAGVEEWRGLPLDALWERLATLDDEFAARQAEAASAGRRLCYLASLEDGRGRVGLQAIESHHPCASARGTENVIAFYTERYSEMPLTVRGPGAGREVTAAGVFADVLRAATSD